MVRGFLVIQWLDSALSLQRGWLGSIPFRTEIPHVAQTKANSVGEIPYNTTYLINIMGEHWWTVGVPR